jgi:hypothetical protein
LANRSRQTFLKRQKERARQEKQRLKAEKRLQRKTDTDTDKDETGAPIGEDPDIAGIVPGPQPAAWEVVDVLTEEEKAALEEEG